MNRSLAGAIALAFFAARNAPAQSCAHALVGRVTDQTGKPVWGASVMVAGQKVHDVHTQTDSTGRYRLCGLAIGRDSVDVYALGMVRRVIPVVVTDAHDDTLDVHLARPAACWRDPRMDATLLAVSEERWKRSGLHSYSFIVTESYYGPGTDIPWLIGVRNDTVIAATEVTKWKPSTAIPFGDTHVRRDAKHFAILAPPRLFERLHRRVTDSSFTTAVKYDSTLGYATEITETMNCVFDAGGTIRIEHLRPRGN